MRICFMAPKAYQLFNPEVKSTFGGAEVQLYLLSTELARSKKFDVHFMVADYGQKEVETYGGVSVWKSLNLKNNILRQALNFFKIFNKINADIYIQRTLTAQSGLIALYCRFKKKRFVYMVAHDSETDGTHKLYRNWVTRFLIKLNFKLANEIIVQNQFQNKELFKENIQAYQLKSSYPLNGELLKGRGEFILWVGRSEDWKRPAFFLELAKSIPREKFVMICAAATDQPELSRDLKKKSGNIANLQFIEFVPFQQVDDYFAKAKIFVNTSIQEGFPNTFIQAVKNKTPILSLNVNPDDFITAYNCGFYCYDDFALLVKNLQRLLSDGELYSQMSANAGKYARENHNITINVNKFLEMITK